MVCNKCGIDKPLTDFYADKKRKSGFCTICKECMKNSVRKRYWEKHEELLEYGRNHYLAYKTKQRQSDKQYRDKVQMLKSPCIKCGESRPYVIEFHHINPKQKSFNICRKTSKSDFSIIENEIKKCVCLCRNCHFEFHYLYGQSPKEPEKALAEYLNKDGQA